MKVLFLRHKVDLLKYFFKCFLSDSCDDAHNMDLYLLAS